MPCAGLDAGAVSKQTHSQCCCVRLGWQRPDAVLLRAPLSCWQAEVFGCWAPCVAHHCDQQARSSHVSLELLLPVL